MGACGRHSHIALTYNQLILGTYGVVLRWFGFQVLLYFSGEAGGLIHRMFTFSELYCCVSQGKGFVALIAVEPRNGR